MFKKIMIASVMLATTTGLTFAEPAPYVGVDLGLNNNTAQLKNIQGLNTAHLNSSGLTGGLLAGFGGTVNQNGFLGGEVFGNIGNNMVSSAKRTDSTGTTDKLRNAYSYGFDLIPGYKVSPTTMLYLKAGVVKTRFKLTQESSTLASGTSASTVAGGRLGLGVQTGLANNVDFRAEVVHTAYNSFKAYGNKITPRNNAATLGLVFKFS